ncbi:hypothetical protein [Burkholderia gladioli]|uniref:hypothetical protein n=1 Tax=Burkholderia gladioli TaxID=28095 RepID=UPI0016400377|nr:hypothetical protein [Burkholderia gladioli]
MTSGAPNPSIIEPRTQAGARFLLLHDDPVLHATFVDVLEPEIEEMALAVARCFERYQRIQERAAELDTDRTGLIRAFTQGALDDLVVSTRLLLAGKLGASGNVALQSIEGVAMALLCSTEEELVLQSRQKQGDVRGYYWQRVMKADDRLVEGQRAVQQLEWNADVLRLHKPWITTLAYMQKRFSGLSHAGMLAVSMRMNFETPMSLAFGGNFDPEKLNVYRADVILRAHIAIDLAKVMDAILESMRPVG